MPVPYLFYDHSFLVSSEIREPDFWGYTLLSQGYFGNSGSFVAALTKRVGGGAEEGSHGAGHPHSSETRGSSRKSVAYCVNISKCNRREK